MRVVIGHQPGPDVGVPCAHHFQDGDGDQRGQGQGHHDLPQVFPVLGAVHLGGQIQLVGNLQKALAQQVDVEHAHQKRHDQNRIRVLPPKGGDGAVSGDGEQFAGDHHRGQQGREQQLLALELQPGKGEGRQDGDEQRQDRGHQTDDHRVHEQPSQIGSGKGRQIVFQHQHPGPEGGHAHAVFIQRFHRGNQHPVKGKQHHQRHQNQEKVHPEQGKGFSCLLPEELGTVLSCAHDNLLFHTRTSQ